VCLKLVQIRTAAGVGGGVRGEATTVVVYRGS
jgi:hypothetical protein